MSRKVHPLADLFPPMSDEEYAAFKDDINKNGLHEKIVTFEEQVLEGRHRNRACSETGQSAEYRRAEDMGIKTWEQARAYVISANIHRRHLDADKKRDLIIKVLAANPEKSDRQHAKDLGVHHSTVSRARNKGEATGAVATVDASTGEDNKKRRRKPRKRKGDEPAKPPSEAERSMRELRAQERERNRQRDGDLTAQSENGKPPPAIEAKNADNPISAAWREANADQRAAFVRQWRAELEHLTTQLDEADKAASGNGVDPVTSGDARKAENEAMAEARS